MPLRLTLSVNPVKTLALTIIEVGAAIPVQNPKKTKGTKKKKGTECNDLKVEWCVIHLLFVECHEIFVHSSS